jgi:alanine dehydrogenase
LRIGIPREIKADELRVAVTPAGVQELVHDGHELYIQHDAGAGAGFSDAAYEAAGARVVDAATVWEAADLIVKVKEVLPEEYHYLRADLAVFTYWHLAADRRLTEQLLASGVTALAYETVTQGGRLPLLAPMSAIAGRLAAQVGATYLERPQGGRGVLVGGVPGVPPAHVVILGAGVVGTNAALIALGLGARVTVVDQEAERLRAVDERFSGRVETVVAHRLSVAELVAVADVVVAAVLVPGARAPHVVDAAMVKSMRPGSVVIDVAVDQGGAVETADHPTTHSDPTYVRYGVVHYAVANMPGAVPVTATLALSGATLPYVRRLAAGIADALREDPALRAGLNAYRGHISHPGVAAAHGLPYTSPEALLPR